MAVGNRPCRRVTAVIGCVVMTASGCTFHGLNSVPLPGVVGHGPGSSNYHIEFANISTLESNSPVMMNDVVVGSVGKMTFSHWHIDVEVSVKANVAVPANAVASIGQTSLLGSLHVALNPPVGQRPIGRLKPGATIPLDKSSTYPSTEQTLSSLSAVVNGGSLGQIGSIIHNFNAALSGRQGDVRDLFSRIDNFVGILDAQRDNLVASMEALNRLAGTFAAQRDVITRLIREIPPALDVLIKERPRITTALEKLSAFSDTTRRLVNGAQDDLVRNLRNLGPTMRALADVGDGLDKVLAYATVFPFGQDAIDRGLKGDYMNLFVKLDFTVPRLKRTTLLGTRWGQEGAPLVPAFGDPVYLNYTLDPLHAGIASPRAIPPVPDSPPPPGGPLPISPTTPSQAVAAPPPVPPPTATVGG
jgi:phospholipid/cholesterol/gamma-HCH transport system substrate-binding protein